MNNAKRVYGAAENVATGILCAAVLAFGAYMTATPQMIGAWLERATIYGQTAIYGGVLVAVAVFGIWGYKQANGLPSVGELFSDYDIEFVDGENNHG